MFVKSLKLKNFRNYEETFVEFSSGINLICGGNGQGKTNLVEALMLSALTKSPRAHSDDDLVKFNENGFFVEAEVERNFGLLKVKTILNENGKHFFVNHNEVKKVSEVFGNLVAVYFSPDDLKIVSESPAERREFMDTDISQLSGSYYSLVQRYSKVLFQRNKLLKTVHNKEILSDQIDVWDEQLASLASLIIRTRKNFISKISKPANQTMKHISKDADELKISYVGAKGESAEEIKSELLKSLKFNLDKDMELGYTSIGPHRDDLRFDLNGVDAKNFASQGQQRSIVLALKLAEMQVFEDELGEKPVLVLDDVFSELDSARQKKLYQKFEGCQVLMTGTVFKFKPNNDYLEIKVKGAKIKTKLQVKKSVSVKFS